MNALSPLGALSATSVLLCASAFAQNDPRDPRSEAWDAFVTNHGGAAAWQVEWNKATNTPRAVFGAGLRVAPGAVNNLQAARLLAAGLLEDQRELLGTEASTFSEEIATRAGETFVFVYEQKFRGLSVISGRADVRLHRVGVVSMFGSRAVPIAADFDITPRVRVEAAIPLALQHLNTQSGAALVGNRPGGMKPDRPELVIWADAEATTITTPVLAWQVQIDNRSATNPIVGKAYVDARSGRVLQWVDEVYTCSFGHTHVVGEASGHDAAGNPALSRLGAAAALRTSNAPTSGSFKIEALPIPAVASMAAFSGNVRAWLNRETSPNSGLTNQTLPNILVSSNVGSAYTDNNGNFTIPFSGTGTRTLTVTFGSNRSRHASGGISDSSSTAVTRSVTATAGTPITIQLLASNSSNLDWVEPTVYWHMDDVNRWLRGLVGNTSQMNTLSNMSAIVNINSSCNAFYSGNRINFYRAGGGCNMTGYSSVIYHEWGHGADAAFGGISQTDGLSEGWGDVLSNYRLNDPIVGLDFTTSGGIIRDARNTRTYPAGGGVHTQGQTWMGFAWDVRNNLASALGTSAGRARAEAIVVASIVADATNQPDAVREVFILDDNDGNLNNGTPNYASLSTAAQGRNLPFPQQQSQSGSIQHTPLGDTNLPNSSRTVTASITVNSGSVSSARLFYNLGSGTSSTAMSGSGSTYTALIPGAAAGATVTYYLTANLSGGSTLRAPGSGAFSYNVNAPSGDIYFSNFESGTAGWTNGLVSRQNDWQRGRPRGKSGSGWQDPSTAYSGSNAWSNDIGAPGWNGAYASNVENWLRSPNINCSGRSNVYVQFRRWLTVERSRWDQADLLVNGQLVYRNDFNSNTVDTGWRLVTYRLPMADNNANVRIEFRLKTDGSVQLGGWNIDDLRVYTGGSLLPNTPEYLLTPAHVALGGQALGTIRGLPHASAFVLLSSNRGPLQLNGLPRIDLGTDTMVFQALSLNQQGEGSFNLQAPRVPSLAGQLLHSQILEGTPGPHWRVSNPTTVLLTR